MRVNVLTHILLAVIAVSVAVIALHPLLSPPPALAVSGSDLYIEPGVHSLRAPDGSREQLGKVVIDLRTGNVWGFPTGTKAPYPILVTESQPPTSKPFLLGKFDLGAMER